MSDGTDRLCQALYGRHPTPKDYLGGSEAKMLHDATAEIERLRAGPSPARSRVLRWLAACVLGITSAALAGIFADCAAQGVEPSLTAPLAGVSVFFALVNLDAMRKRVSR